MKKTYSRVSLLTQISNCISTGNFFAPSYEIGPGDQVVGLMTEPMKAAITLIEEKKALLKEKSAEYQKNSEPESMMLMFSNMIPFGTSGIGGAMKSMMIMPFGKMFGFDDAHAQSLHHELVDVISHDTLGEHDLLDTMYLLKYELNALHSLLYAEAYVTTGIGTIEHGKHLQFTAQYEIVTSATPTHAMQAEEHDFRTTLEHMSQHYHMYSLKDDSDLLKQFNELQSKLEDENVECSFGTIPNLAGEETTMVFFPKSLTAKGMYQDDRLNDTGTSKGEAEELKDATEKLFTAIKAVGELYEHKKNKEKEAVA